MGTLLGVANPLTELLEAVLLQAIRDIQGQGIGKMDELVQCELIIDAAEFLESDLARDISDNLGIIDLYEPFLDTVDRRKRIAREVSREIQHDRDPRSRPVQGKRSSQERRSSCHRRLLS